MKLFAISDLHLDQFEPMHRMNTLDPCWRYHPGNLIDNWKQLVQPDDWVLCPGDISWGLKTEELSVDYQLLDDLPGNKVLSPGNHDYGYWKTGARIKRFCEQWPSLFPLRNDALRIDEIGVVIAAVKGFLSPEDALFGKSFSSAADLQSEHKRFDRELARLKGALSEAARLREPDDKLGVMIHYPPFADLDKNNAFTRAIADAGSDFCVYGHLHHQKEWQQVFQGTQDGVHYQLVAADYLNMKPVELKPAELQPA